MNLRPPAGTYKVFEVFVRCVAPSPLVWVLAAAAVVASLAAYPFVATAIAYRRRDNGLAYILLVLGVGIWNGMFAVGLFAAEPLVRTFFLALALVGSLLAGLGWFLFAATASSTPNVPNERLVFGIAAVLVGLDIALAITAPIHDFFWVATATVAASPTVSPVVPRLGYWLHTFLLVLLFGAGTVLFSAAWRAGERVQYSRAYTVAGAVTVGTVVASNVLAPGGLTVAPLAAASLSTIGWIQARRGRVLGGVRRFLGR